MSEPGEPPRRQNLEAVVTWGPAGGLVIPVKVVIVEVIREDTK